MKNLQIPLLGIGVLIGVLLFGRSLFMQSAAVIVQPSGTIELRALNQSCSAVIRNGSSLNPLELNDGKLDSIEESALSEGCTLQATAIAPNGMRLTDVPLALIRREAPSGPTELHEKPRRTDAYGNSTWSIQLLPNTNFIYEVISPNPVGRSVRSNQIDIQLCTGDESIPRFQVNGHPDIGRGCR